MNENLVSVIVPVYNVAQYVAECLNSLLNQTYRNLEIIVVDDGSTDNSLQICNTFLSDTRVKVFHKENGGLSDARNYGLEKATGDFVLFIDSDDFLDLDMIRVLYSNLQSTNSDISICGSYKYYSKDKVIPNQKNCELVCLDRIKAIEWLYDFDHYGVGVWNKLFKKNIFDGIKFPYKKLSEDYFVMFKIFYKAEKICYESKPLYNYRQRQNSITKNRTTSFDVIEAHDLFVEIVKDSEPSLEKCAKHAYVFANIGVYDTILKNGDKRDKLKFLRNNILKDYKTAKKYETNRLRRLQLFIFKYFNVLYSFLFRLYMRIKK